VQPYNKGFDRVHECDTDKEVEQVVEGAMEFQVKDADTKSAEQNREVIGQAMAQTGSDGADIPTTNRDAPETKDGKHVVWTTSYYLGISLKKGERHLCAC